MKNISTTQKYIGSSLLLGLWGVLTHWGFWINGVDALGWNTTAFWGVILATLITCGKASFKKDWLWLIPITLMIASFSLWEGAVIKSVTFFLLPVLFGFFYNYSKINFLKLEYWNGTVLGVVFGKYFSMFEEIPGIFAGVLKNIGGKINHKNKKHLGDIGIGLLLLIVVSSIVIPLLSSVDGAFGTIVQDAFFGFLDFFNVTLILKIIVLVITSVLVMALFLSWNKEENVPIKNKEKTQYNGILIVLLSGLILLYGLFIYTQFESILNMSLSADFESMVEEVKNGFWQLFFISILNTILFFVFYYRTNLVGKWLLRIFILASTIILISAGSRLGLYVSSYGLSYEKFLALYVVLFSLWLFLYLIISCFSLKKNDILKALAFGFLWGFGALSVLPVESIMFHSNNYFSKLENSRVELTDVTMFSVDVLQVAKNTYGLPYADEATPSHEIWNNWYYKIGGRAETKKWYEYNLSLWLNKK